MSHEPDRVARRSALPRAIALWLAVFAGAPVGGVAQERTEPSAPPAAAAARSSIAAPPMAFEEIRGQADATAKYLVRSRGYAVLLSDDGATVRRDSRGRTSPLQMTFQGAERNARLTATDPLHGRIYYASPDARGALTAHATYERVRQPNLYPGIDLVYYANDRHLEFDFVVAPGASPKKIRIAFSGAEKMTLEPSGELSFRLDGEEVRLKKPVIYQEHDGTRRQIAGGYRILDARAQIVAFSLGAYDKSRPLVIDPTIVFATYVGGASWDAPRQLRVNARGEIYLFANSGDISTLPSNPFAERLPLAPSQPGFGECFLSKLSNDATSALYTVIFEGAGCQAMDVATDAQSLENKIHVQVGTSSHYQRTITETPGGGLAIELLQGAYDACLTFPCGPVDWLRADSRGNVYFIMQYHASGATGLEFVHELRKVNRHGQLAGALPLVQLPLYDVGGINYLRDRITGFDIDESGNAFITGYGMSPNIISPTSDALQSVRPSGYSCTTPGQERCYDAFLMKVATGDDVFQLVYASYVGGAADDSTFGVAVDRWSGAVYVTGITNSADLPSTGNEYHPVSVTSDPRAAGFLLKLDLNASGGSQLRFGTLISELSSNPVAIAVLPGGQAAIVGDAYDGPCQPQDRFPLANPLFPARGVDRIRPFLSVFAADGSSLPFSTYLESGAVQSWARVLATNGSATVYTGLETADPSLATPGTVQPSPGGNEDALVQAIDLSDIFWVGEAPRITLAPSTIEVPATEPQAGVFPLVCGRLFTCDLVDPDEQYLTHLFWEGPNGYRLSATGLPAPANQPGIVPGAVVMLGVGSHTFRLTARNEGGAVGSGTLTVNVRAENTFTGIDQHVVLTDPRFVGLSDLGSEFPIELTFANVSTPGLTWLLSRSDQTPRAPDGLQAGSPPYYYDIASNAGFSGPITVCFNVRGMSFARPREEVSIYRRVGDGWVLLDSTNAPSVNQVCAEAAELGTFAIFYPHVPETAIVRIAGTGFMQSALDGNGGDPRDDFVELAQATESALTRPGQLARDAAGHVYVADNGSTLGSRIRQLRTDGSISTVIAPGVCYGFGPMAIDPAGQFLYCVRPNQATGAQDIIKYDVATQGVSLMTSTTQVMSMLLDQNGDLLFSNGTVYRVPAAGGDPQLVFAGSQRPDIAAIPYDRFWALAFDRERHLLAGGFGVIRIAPGADGLVDGSPDETVTRVGGVTGASLTDYSHPFSGDGRFATQAKIILTYQMIVAADGAVVFTDQSHRVRRIDPGPDGVVNGDDEEIITTIAGYYSSSGAEPSPFATSEYGDFRGVVEDPQSPGSFIVSNHIRQAVQRFGIRGGGPPEDSADLAIALTTTPAPASVGEDVSFVVAVTNHGPQQASSSQVTGSLASGLVFVRDDAQGACTVAADVIACGLGDLAAGAARAIRFVVRPVGLGTLPINFTVSSSTADPTSANNSVVVNVTSNLVIHETITVADAVDPRPALQVSINETIQVTDTVDPRLAVQLSINETIHVTDDVPPIATAADLSVGVVVAPATTVDVGTTVRYTATLTNNGPAIATGATVGMFVPVGLTVTSIVFPSGAPCAIPLAGVAGWIECTVSAPVPTGGQHALTVEAAPNRTGTIASTFRVSGVPADPTPGNNEAIISITANAAADLAITAVPSRALLNIGDAISYAITVTNTGLVPATNVQFAASSSGVAIDHVNLPPLSCLIIFGLGSWNCGLGELTPGAVAQFTVLAHATSGPASTATFSVSTTTADPVQGNNAAVVSVAINRPPTVDAGPDREVVVTTNPAAVAVSVGVTDPDGDAITSIAWYEGATFLVNGAFTEVPLAVGTHTLTVVATDNRGGQSSDSVVINVRPATLPRPATVLASSGAPGQATVNWAPVAGATEYRVYRSVDPVTTSTETTPPIAALTSNATLVATVSDTAFQDNGLPALVRQFYAVVAVNGAAVSQPTAAAQVIVQAHPDASIFGFADTHNHQFANLGFGRSLIWGSAFSDTGGLGDALHSCELAHGFGGFGDIIGNVLTQSVGHDTGGFDPTSTSEFTGWPRFDTRTHQQAYYEWVQRAFEGGQRLMVMHAINTKVLCQVAPHDSQFSCEDMASIEAQLLEARRLENYVDQLSGGPGRGWYRIAYSGNEARRIINSGKMAVVLGIEVDELFGCGRNATCTLDDIRTRLDHFHDLGVRHLFPIGHFDNAFGGAALYDPLYNYANFVQTGAFFAPRACTTEGYRYAPGAVNPSWLSILSVIAGAIPGAPVSGFTAECNARGLLGLGEFLVREMMARGMIIDIDHMSSLAANRVLTIAEQHNYPGVVSGHSGPLPVSTGNKANEGAKTTSQLARISNLGGLSSIFLNQGERGGDRGPNGIIAHGTLVANDCSGSSKTLAQAYLAAVDVAGGPATAAVGFGSDFNGLGGQPGPRFGSRRCPGDAPVVDQNGGVAYPFDIVAPAGVDAGKLGKATLPNRLNNSTPDPWDFNRDGLAHAGMVPDLIADLRSVGVNDTYLQPLFRSAEAYVRMWERADGTAPPFQGGTLIGAGGDVPVRASSVSGSAQPVTATFAIITDPGYLVAEPMENPPPPPSTFVFLGFAFDLITTATYTGPITVCMEDSSYASSDQLLHFESGNWVNITASGNSNGTVCGQTSSLSPFVVARSLSNSAPAANAGTYAPFEATSPAGATVTLSGSGSDPDAGDLLTFRWTEGSTVLGTAASLSTTLALGAHDVTLTVTDSHGASASSTTRVVVTDTTPPAVTAPLPLAIPATEALGARAAAWPALATWLASASARDLADAAPINLTAEVNGTPVTAATLFRIGTTTVRFRFRDAAGNVGAATSAVSVAVGKPRFETALVGSGTLAGGRRYVDLSVKNTGTGIAQWTTMVVVALPAKGLGIITVRTPQPISIGDLSPGASRTVRIEMTIPGSVKEVLLVTAGAFLNVQFVPDAFSTQHTFKP